MGQSQESRKNIVEGRFAYSSGRKREVFVWTSSLAKPVKKYVTTKKSPRQGAKRATGIQPVKQQIPQRCEVLGKSLKGDPAEKRKDKFSPFLQNGS